MIFTKPTPIAIDYKIQQLQTATSEYLDSLWNVTNRVYGRVYRNSSDGKLSNQGGAIKAQYSPEAYIGSGEYTQAIFFDDTVGFQMFFDIGETIKIDPLSGYSRSFVYLYFFGDLSKIFPDATDRHDEECVDTIADFVNTKFGFIVHSKHVGVKKVLSDYIGANKDIAMLRDMQPFYCFRLDMEISSYPTQLNCNGSIPFYDYNPLQAVPIYAKDRPKGGDYYIGKANGELYNYLLAVLNLTPSQYNAYPRIYRNVDRTNGKGYLPYAFKNGGNVDYTHPLMFDDTLYMQSFWDIGEVVPVNGQGLSTNHISLYFFADLKKIYGNGYRNDMELMELVCQYINTKYGFIVHAKQVGLMEVLKNYSGYIKNMTMNRDMQPFYCFRLDMKLNNYNTAFELCSEFIPTVERQFNPDQFNSGQFS